ncbi:NinB protein [Roseateles sp. YR242]|uniref:recombination protein NinB n=1 Tax=Roseateles sp. YR242 TaxID=1855305 RepID=UPI0008B85E83|nr:recombination protein NinB [Roseateles sp. YR242]SEL12743.1 NinB protein [Roseateles sp. YR242]
MIYARLPNTFEGHSAILHAWKQIKAMLRLNQRPMMLIAYEEQSLQQQHTYHSALKDLARDCLLGGEQRDAETWKRSTLAAFYEATRQDPEFAPMWQAMEVVSVPSMDCVGFHLYSPRSRVFPHPLAGAYLAFLHETGDARGVKWSPTSLGRQEAANDASASQREAA